MVDLNQNKGVYPRAKDKALNDAADKRDLIAKWTAAYPSIPDSLFGGEPKVVNLELLEERALLRDKVGNLAGDLLERDDKIKKLKAKEDGVRKEVNKLIGINEDLASQNKDIKNKLADALNAEQVAKKDLEELNINIDKVQSLVDSVEIHEKEIKRSKLQAELDKLA